MLNNLFILNILNSIRVYLAGHLNDDTEDKERKFIDTMLLSIDKSIITLKREINIIKLDANKKQD